MWGPQAAWSVQRKEGEGQAQEVKRMSPLCASSLAWNFSFLSHASSSPSCEVGTITLTLSEEDSLPEVTFQKGQEQEGSPGLPGAPAPLGRFHSLLSPQFSGGLQDLLLPQNQFTMFLYCFIFIHIIYITKEMIFFLFSKHYLFCIAAILLCLIKTLWSYFQVPSLSLHHWAPPSFTCAPLPQSELAVRKGLLSNIYTLV